MLALLVQPISIVGIAAPKKTSPFELFEDCGLLLLHTAYAHAALRQRGPSKIVNLLPHSPAPWPPNARLFNCVLGRGWLGSVQRYGRIMAFDLFGLIRRSLPSFAIVCACI